MIDTLEDRRFRRCQDDLLFEIKYAKQILHNHVEDRLFRRCKDDRLF